MPHRRNATRQHQSNTQAPAAEMLFPATHRKQERKKESKTCFQKIKTQQAKGTFIELVKSFFHERDVVRALEESTPGQAMSELVAVSVQEEDRPLRCKGRADGGTRACAHVQNEPLGLAKEPEEEHEEFHRFLGGVEDGTIHLQLTRRMLGNAEEVASLRRLGTRTIEMKPLAMGRNTIIIPGRNDQHLDEATQPWAASINFFEKKIWWHVC